MMRSMYAAVAGLRTHQQRMDVIGDNIANVNTPGFKRARATFQDIFYQTLRGGSAGSETRGGTNPQQIGLGISLSTIDVIHTQGAAQPTGKQDDLMIQGDGFFVLSNVADPAGAGADEYVQVYYSRAGAFRFVPYDSNGDGTIDENDTNCLVNPANGMFVMGRVGDGSGGLTDTIGIIEIPNDAKSFSIDINGNVYYVGADGTENLAGRIVIAKFTNPAGLEKVGENMYKYAPAAGHEPDDATANGLYLGGSPGEDGRGTIIPGALEMSNVELAQEFTDMIVTQRGFQANARVITVSDEMLAELANLKR